MPQITREEFERLPQRIRAFLTGVPLHDAWAWIYRARMAACQEPFSAALGCCPYAFS